MKTSAIAKSEAHDAMRALCACVALLACASIVRADNAACAGNATRATRAALLAKIEQQSKSAADAETAVLSFKPGEYHFYPEHAASLVRYVSNHDNSRAPRRFIFDVRGAKNLTIDGNGARFIFHGNVIPFLIEDSSGVTIRNLTIDWATPLLYEAEVLASDKTGFTVRVRADEPFEVDRGSFLICADGERLPVDAYTEFSPGGGGQAAGSIDVYGFAYRAEKTDAADGRTVRFTALDPGGLRRPPAPGNILFLRHHVRIAPGFFLQQARDTTLENITLHHAPAMGLLAQRCENVSIKQMRVIPNAALGREVSAHYDATHFTGCRGRILVEDGEFCNMLDDALNVHGIYLQVLRRVDDHTLQVRMAHFQSQGHPVAGPGDRMRFVRDQTLLPYGEAVVARVSRKGTDELLFTFREPLPADVRALDALENISWTPEVVFRRNRVAGNRARSILISTAGRVVIEDNFFGATGSAIRISGDARSWFESGPVEDVLIARNVFENPMRCAYGFAAIDIDPEITTPEGSGFYHRNIRILENRFRLCDAGVLLARSVDGLEFSKNTIELARDFPSLGRQRDAIEIIHCRDVRVDGNRFTGWDEKSPATLKADAGSAATMRVGEGQGLAPRR